MSNPGYIMVDCGGLDLDDSTKKVITGIYDRAKEALATGKPCYATNCFMSEMPCSPVSVVAWDHGNDGIIAIGHMFRIMIAADDGVTVTKFIAS